MHDSRIKERNNKYLAVLSTSHVDLSPQSKDPSISHYPRKLTTTSGRIPAQPNTATAGIRPRHRIPLTQSPQPIPPPRIEAFIPDGLPQMSHLIRFLHPVLASAKLNDTSRLPFTTLLLVSLPARAESKERSSPHCGHLHFQMHFRPTKTYHMRERDTMDRSRGVITAPKVQVRRLINKQKNTKMRDITHMQRFSSAMCGM